YYSLATPADKVALRIYDIDGKQVRDLKGPSKAGLHRVAWDLGRNPAKGKGGKGGKGGLAGKGGPGKGGPATAPPFAFGPRVAVPPGDYRIVLDVDGRELTHSIRVEADPNGPSRPVAVDDDEDEEAMAGPIYR